MTESEKQQIINEVLDSLKVNSLTIEQLVEVASFSSDDCVELTGGRRISLAMLKELFNKELTETVGKKLAISDLASGRGESTTTAMTQAAVTQELVAQEEKLTELSSKSSGVCYVTCNTPVGTACKTVTVTGLSSLTTGIRLLVKMTNKNTASNATLNINSLGEKPLFYNNTRVSGDNAWEAGEVLDVFYDGTNFYSSNVQGGSGEGGNLILEWNTDAASTRKQVKQSDRKSLLQISYKDADGNPINEQYIGTTFTDTEWAKDSNWEKLAKQSQVDLIGHIANMAGAYNFDTVDTFNNISSPASIYSFNFENCKKGDILKLKVLNVTGYTGNETITAIIRTYIDGQSATTSQYFVNNESIILNKEYEIELNFESNVLQYLVRIDNSNASSIFELKIERKYSSRKIDVEKIK